VGLTYRRTIKNIETGEIKQSTLAEYMDDHVTQVQQAVSEGKPVPREVLQEYKAEAWADEALATLPEAEAPAESEQDNG